MTLSASIMILVGLFSIGCSGKAVENIENNTEKNANNAEESLWHRAWKIVRCYDC
ncbi:hypothetical protein GCM10008921_02420 [Metaclostridioides mangenotii]|jgi:hypothetical protein